MKKNTNCIHAVVLVLLTYLIIGCAGSGGIAKSGSESELLVSQHKLDSCTLQVRELRQGNIQQPRLVMINGVPVTSLIYRDLTELLAEKNIAQGVMLDLPGTGGSRLKDGVAYTWEKQRACIYEWLKQQPPVVLVVHDLAGPVAIPLLNDADNIRGVVMFNTVLKPSELKPPFPLNWLRSTGVIAKPMAMTTPAFFYKWRLRDIGFSQEGSVTSEELQRLYNDTRNNGGMASLVDVMQGFEVSEQADNEIVDALTAKIPRLVIWGEADPVLGDEWLSTLP